MLKCDSGLWLRFYLNGHSIYLIQPTINLIFTFLSKAFSLNLKPISYEKTLIFVSVFALGTTYAQNCSELFISEYIEGSGSDKALEIYNPTGSAIDLTGYRLERFSNGESTSAASGVLDLSGTIAPYSAFVIAHGSGITYTPTGQDPSVSAGFMAMAALVTDQYDHGYPNPTAMNGNDAIALLS